MFVTKTPSRLFPPPKTPTHSPLPRNVSPTLAPPAKPNSNPPALVQQCNSPTSLSPCVYVYSFFPTKAPAGHIIRSANQFVDQGYNNFPAQASGGGQWREPSSQRVLSPGQPMATSAPHTNGNATRIIPIAIEGVGRGGPVSQSPVLLQK